MRGEEEFIQAAMRLRANAPQAWDEFVAVTRKLAAIKAAELVRAPHETIYQMQGQARAWEEIATMMVEAPTKALKAEEKKRGRDANPNPSGPPRQSGAAGYPPPG